MQNSFYKVSNKNKLHLGKRPYTLRARARRRDAVHLRITEAAVHLHGTVGPARTTISDIAKHAGVRRATVYNHFPTDLELMDACSSHWFLENPPPDPASWAAIPEPGQRIEAALRDLYAYYDHGQDMLGKVLRDAALVPALERIIDHKWHPLLETMVEVLARGPSASSAETPIPDDPEATDLNEPPHPHHDDVARRAGLSVVLDFFTWRTLTAQGLSNDDAARLAAGWVNASDTSRRATP